MDKKFETIFLEEAAEFIKSQDVKTQEKIFYVLDKSKYVNDPKFFKKLKGEIWEFRIKYRGLQLRLFAFWDKRDNKNTLVVSTHGKIKKTDKVLKSEIEKAEAIRMKYLKNL